MKVKIDINKVNTHLRITYGNHWIQLPFENLNDLITDLKKEEKKFYRGKGINNENYT